MILGLDMKFICSTKAEGVTPDLFGDPSQVFWREGEDKDPLFFGLKQITSASKVENATLSFGGIKFENTVTLKKWAIVPRAHQMIDLTFTASINGPTEKQRLGILEKLRQHGALKVEGELDLIDLMEASPEDDQSELELD